MEDKKVLIVDDNLQNIKLIGKLLRNKGFKIIIAESGEESLNVLDKILPDIILMDILMPGMNGYETCRKIKENELTKEIPIIFLSALDDSTNKVEGFSVGGVDYVSKPIEPEELYARINTHITIKSLKETLQEDLVLKNRLIEEIKEKTEELIFAQEHLLESQKLASLAYLVSGMSHELNTPLSISITSSSLVQEKVKNLSDNIVKKEDIPQIIKEVSESNSLLVKNLYKIKELIKTFKELTIEHEESEIKDFRLRSVIEKTVLHISAIKKNNIEVNISGEDILIKNSYPNAIDRIIINLVNNSLIHGFFKMESGKIDINIEVDKNLAIINFKDNGCGIDENNADKVFNPFFTTNKSKGIGLGLSVIYNLVTQKLNGSINLKEATQGCHIQINLPIS